MGSAAELRDALVLQREQSVESELAWVSPRLPSPKTIVLCFSCLGMATLGFVLSFLGLGLSQSLVGLVTLMLVGAYGGLAAKPIVERYLRGTMRRRIQAVRLRAIASASEGDLVRVRGTAKLGRAGSLPERSDCMFERRLVGAMVKERAVDFILIDDEGAQISVEVANARLAQTFFLQSGTVEAVVRTGDTVEVIGRAHRVVDPHAERLPHQNPTCLSLCAPRSGPLLIVQVDEKLALPTASPQRLLDG